MKKLFNYALLAAALLIGVNVNAKDVAKIGSNTYPTIEAAFAAAQGTAAKPDEIIMLDDANFGNCRIDLSGKYVIWDLAGKTVGTLPEATYSGFVMKGGHFEMVNTSASPATLNLKGNWNKEHPVYDNDHEGYVIMIYGSSEDVANYSTFIMDGDIRYTALGEDNYAIKVEGWPATENYKNAYGVTVDIKKGYVYGRYGALFVSGNIKATTGNRPVIKVEKDAELEAGDQCTFLTGSLDGKGKGDRLAAAQYYAKKKWSDVNKWTEQEAKDWALAYKESSAAIYGGGVAEWTINGYVHGGNGLYIKGGKVVLDGARVSATAAEYHEPILKSSGFLACGSAIILDSNEGYGELDGITISNSTVTSDKGYAIEEVVTAGTEKLPKIEVTSGTFVGGLGAITTTNEEQQAIIDRGDIGGGEWHNSNVNQYLDNNHTTLDFVDGDGKHYQVVVPIGSDDWKQSIAAAAGQAEGAKYAYVKDDEPVTANTTVEFVRIAEGKTVTVKEGATLDAGTLMTEKTGKIIVEAGGTLIVSGEQGAYTYDENSIVVKASQTTSGQILINPAVVLNTTPKATVEYVSGAYKVGEGNFVFDFFGAPMNVVNKVTSNNNAYSSAFFVNENASDWILIGALVEGVETDFDYNKFNRPFGFFEIQTTNPIGEEQTFSFKGNIYGNTSPEVNFQNGWPGFSNAYMANVDVDAFWDYLDTQTTDANIYTYRQIGPNTLTWDANNPLAWTVSELKPLKAFMLRNTNASTKLAMDYEAMVWNPAIGIKPAGAPRMSNIEKATIRVENANGVYDKLTVAQDASFDANCKYNAEKYMNTELNLYVKAEKNLAIAAFDNLNNTFVGFNCKNAGKYTISFENVTGNFDLIDMNTNARINMSEGATYEFIAEAGENAHRFMIVAAAKAPTNTPATKAAVKATKALINDQIVISNGERFFNVLGADVK